jgi:hypothetical protein
VISGLKVTLRIAHKARTRSVSNPNQAPQAIPGSESRRLQNALLAFKIASMTIWEVVMAVVMTFKVIADLTHHTADVTHHTDDVSYPTTAFEVKRHLKVIPSGMRREQASATTGRDRELPIHETYDEIHETYDEVGGAPRAVFIPVVGAKALNRDVAFAAVSLQII